MNMFTAGNKGRLRFAAVVVGAALALSGCATGDPLDPGTGEESEPTTIVVGSQAYYSNEIIAEIYAQALEDAGFDVERKFQIGQREAYLPALEAGEVDLFPEYTGNLLEFYAPDTTATKADEVYAELEGALPEGLTVLEMSPATDQDSYNVTKEFAEANDLVSIGDLADLDGLVLGGAPELEERPYGPEGLEEVYGVTVSFEATGPTTVDALLEGVIDVGNVYSADPRISSGNLVTLEDPEGLFLASNVVPLVNEEIADEIDDVINRVSAALTPEGLSALNARSVDEQLSSEQIATDWLTENGLIG